VVAVIAEGIRGGGGGGRIKEEESGRKHKVYNSRAGEHKRRGQRKLGVSREETGKSFVHEKDGGQNAQTAFCL